jgi:hypothetical protein
VTYKAADSILKNMSVAKNHNAKNSFLLAITEEINFNMSVSVEGTSYDSFCVGTEPTDTTIPLVDNSFNQHLLGANGSTPISSSNSICAMDVPSFLTSGEEIKDKSSFTINLTDFTFRDLQNNPWADRENGATIIQNL